MGSTKPAGLRRTDCRSPVKARNPTCRRIADFWLLEFYAADTAAGAGSFAQASTSHLRRESRRASLVHRPAAVHRQHLTRYEVAKVRGQKEDRADEII
jgi:hypothetical protein